MKTSVDKAIAVIRGYCNKTVSCEKCRFYDEEDDCPFLIKSPCDWSMDKREKAGQEGPGPC